MNGFILHLILLVLFVVPLIIRKAYFDVYVIWGIYFLSSFLCLFSNPVDMIGFGNIDSYNDFYFIFYAILVIYSLTPLYNIATPHQRPPLNAKFRYNNISKLFLAFVIIGGIYSIFYSLPFALKSMSLGAKEVRSVVLHDEESTVFPPTIWTTIAVTFATFFSIYISIFYLSINSNLKKRSKYLLFIISLSYVINSLAFTARDGLIFFLIFNFIFLLFYWKSFNRKMKSRIFMSSIIIVTGVVLLLFSFTSDRFEDFSKGIYAYIATQPFVFAENILQRENLDNFYGFSLRFPLFNKALGIPIEEIQRTSIYEWTFGTFLTDFYNVNGFLTLIILLIIFTEYFRFQFRVSKMNPLRFNLVYAFYVHFMISGVFYFRLGSFSGNVFMLVLMILIFLQPKSLSK